MRDTTHIVRLAVPLPPLDSPRWQSSLRAFAWGMRSVTSTVLTLVLFATYLGIGALAHDTHFSLGWVLASTALVWAGPAQIILISTLGSGATVVQAAIAVTVSAIRLFPMVVSVLPMIRTPQTKRRHLVLATHFIAVTLWVECFRLLPHVPRERRIAFTHGLGIGLVSVCLIATTIGYGLAANLPQLFAAAILLLTPLAFLLSTSRNCRQLADILALLLGLALFPLASMLHTGIDILISGVSAGTIAYGVHWWREHDPEKWNPVFREDHAQNERTLESDSIQLNQTRARE
jgi:predicted branched-subunit amino acid permease